MPGDESKHDEDKFERKERHSADPKSSVKGKPKKEGAGGAGTWGKAGEDDAGPAALDKNDPNYDSEAEKEKAKAAKGGKKEKQAKDGAEKPKSPEDLEKEKAAKLKKVKKEGGKRGVEIEGAADMGGLQFFCTSVDEPDGDIDLLTECVTAMNQKCDPTEEERKGGSGHIGKMVFSAGVEQLAVVAYVPEEKVGVEGLECKAWLQKVLDLFGGEVVSEAKDVCTGKVKADGDKGIFPLKIREAMILEANNYLRKLGLFPEDKDDDDDEMVFGDDDFPSL